MRKFSFILSNFGICFIGLLAINLSISLRIFLTNVDYNTIIIAFSFITVLTLLAFGVIALLMGIHGLIYHIFNFSIYNYVCKRLDSTEEKK